MTIGGIRQLVLAGLIFILVACGRQDSQLLGDSQSTSGGSGNVGPAGPSGPVGQAGAAGPAGPAGAQGESFREATRKLLVKVKEVQSGVVNLLCNGASGSGTRISSDTVITAYHVIENASSCVVRSNGLQVAVGGLLSRSPSGRDIGYIKGLNFSVDISKVGMVRQKRPLVGDLLVLLSYPQLFQNDLQTSIGFVTDDDAQSSLDTMGIEWRNAIISDMSAGGGSSGGPVFNQDGEFVGIHVGGFSGAADGGLELNFQLIFEQND